MRRNTFHEKVGIFENRDEKEREREKEKRGRKTFFWKKELNTLNIRK
jgi:hypothetical protein